MVGSGIEAIAHPGDAFSGEVAGIGEVRYAGSFDFDHVVSVCDISAGAWSYYRITYLCIADKINNFMPAPDNYFDLVYEITRQIPRGRVSTYGAIADYLALGSARMVGWALRHSFSNDQVPAHRVVNRLGELSGRHQFPRPDMMQELLEQEGVEVNHDRVQRFAELFWHPQELDASDFFTK